MNDKEKADCLIELHKVQMDHFRQTRDLEFKVNLALWTIIILSGRFLYVSTKLEFSGWTLVICIVGAILACLGHLIFWMMPIQRSEDIDNLFINQYRSAVEKLVETKIEKHEPFPPRFAHWLPEKLRLAGWKWLLAETGITAFLLISVIIVLFIKG